MIKCGGARSVDIGKPPKAGIEFLACDRILESHNAKLGRSRCPIKGSDFGLGDQ